MEKHPDSFLIVNTFGIGDVLFSTPLIRNLAEHFPGARIYYLANRKTVPVLASHPVITKVFIYERDEFVAAQKRSLIAGFTRYRAFISEIRREKIDVCLDLSLNTPFGFFALLAGIPVRLGLDFKSRGRFLTKKIRIDGFTSKHVADYYLDVLKLLDIEPKPCPLEVYPSEPDRQKAREFLRSRSSPVRSPIIGIAPCGGDAFGKDAHIKRWPAEKFSLLIDRLARELNALVFIFAGPKEKQEVAAIIAPVKDKSRVYDFSDRSLSETIALVEQCGLFIGNDTGPLRFADALHKKLIALFGPVDEKVYGPYPSEPGRTVILTRDVPCRPCYQKFRLPVCVYDRRCLKDILVEEVLKASQRLLSPEPKMSD